MNVNIINGVDMTISQVVTRPVQGLIADEVAAPYDLMNQRESVRRIDAAAETLRIVNDVRAPGTPAVPIDVTVTTPVQCYPVEHARVIPVPVEAMNSNTAAFNEISTWAMQPAKAVKVAKEKALVDMIVASLTVSGKTLISTAASWGTNGTPIKDLSNQISTLNTNSGLVPNRLALSMTCATAIMNNSEYRNLVGFGGQGSGMGLNPYQLGGFQVALAQILNLEKVLIGASTYNTAMQGQTPSFSNIWGSYALLYYTEPMTGTLTANAFIQPRWTPVNNLNMAFNGSGGLVDGWRVDYWADNPTVSVNVRVRQYYEFLTLFGDADPQTPATLWSNPIAAS